MYLAYTHFHSPIAKVNFRPDLTWPKKTARLLPISCAIWAPIACEMSIAASHCRETPFFGGVGPGIIMNVRGCRWDNSTFPTRLEACLNGHWLSYIRTQPGRSPLKSGIRTRPRESAVFPSGVGGRSRSTMTSVVPRERRLHLGAPQPYAAYAST